MRLANDSCIFAGVVEYDSKDFLDKNKDSLREDLVEFLSHSENDYVASLFQKEIMKKSVKVSTRNIGLNQPPLFGDKIPRPKFILLFAKEREV